MSERRYAICQQIETGDWVPALACPPQYDTAPLAKALSDLLPILEAVRYTAGLGKTQMARIEAARAALARCSPQTVALETTNAV